MARPVRIGVANIAFVLLAALFASCHRPNSMPVPAIDGPRSGRVLDTLEFTLTFPDTACGPVSYQMNWGDGDSAQWLGPCNPESVLPVHHAWDQPGKYAVCTRALIGNEGLSAWSDSLVISVKANRPPDRPSAPVLPRYWQTDTGFMSVSTSQDAEQDSIAIRVLTERGDTSAWSQFVASGETATVVLTFTSAGSQNVLAQAKDIRGDLSDLSDPCSCRVMAGRVSLRWSFDIGRGFRAAASIGHDGTVYAFQNGGLRALNPDGSLRWALDSAQYQGAPCIGTDGTIYCGGRGLSAVNPNGSVKWFSELGSQACALGPDGTIYTAAGSDLIALTSGGVFKWRYETDGFIDYPPAVGRDGTIYFGSNDFHAYAVNPDGSLKWRRSGGDWFDCAPAIADDGTIYFMCYDGTLYARNPDGSLRWQQLIGHPWYYRDAIVGPDGTVFVGSIGDWFAFDSSGRQVWSQVAEGYTGYAVAIAEDGTVYWSDTAGLTVLFPDFTVRQRFTEVGNLVGYITIAADGTVYGSGDGRMYALNGVARPCRRQWTMHLHDAQHTGRAE